MGEKGVGAVKEREREKKKERLMKETKLSGGTIRRKIYWRGSKKVE